MTKFGGSSNLQVERLSFCDKQPYCGSYCKQVQIKISLVW